MELITILAGAALGLVVLGLAACLFGRFLADRDDVTH